MPLPRNAGAHVEPLHLADAGSNMRYATAPAGIARRPRDQHHAARPRIFARQSGELVVDILEADVLGERSDVFAKQHFDTSRDPPASALRRCGWSSVRSRSSSAGKAGTQCRTRTTRVAAWIPLTRR